MTFFGRTTSVGKIKIDTDGVNADSPDVQKRLDRIATNYERLNEVLCELEGKIARDERLNPAKPQPAESGAMAPSESDRQPIPDQNPALASADPKKPR